MKSEAGLPGEYEGAQNTRPPTQQWGYNVGGGHIAVQQTRPRCADIFEQLRLLHYTATHDDSLRRKYAGPVVHCQREIVSFERPRRMIVGQVRRGTSPARLHGRAARQTFQAIAVEWAATGKRIVCQVVRD